jgi:hypothetical protein
MFGLQLDRANRYTDSVCPYLFKNAQLVFIVIMEQVNSYLYVNMLRFAQNSSSVDDSKSKSINSVVSKLNINGYNFKLDTGLLHPLVFESLANLSLYYTLDSIQLDLFKYFKKLTAINLFLDSVGNFFHRVGVQWMQWLPLNSFIYIKQFDSSNLYTYPNSDFCLFDILYNTSVIIEIGDPVQECTATNMLLCSMANKLNNTCDCIINQTEIGEKLKLCVLNSSKQSDFSTYPDFYQTRILDMLLMDLIPFVLIPCGCILGMFF